MRSVCSAASAAVSGNAAASDIDVTYDPLDTQGVSQVAQPISLRVAGSSGSGSSTVIAQFVDWDSNTTLRIGSRGPIYTIEGDNTVVTNRYGAALLPNRKFIRSFHRMAIRCVACERQRAEQACRQPIGRLDVGYAGFWRFQ
jgi:hypothetical protein